MKVERILYATDFSEGASHALPYAVDLAKNYNAKLYVLHVVYDFVKATGIHVPHISHDEFIFGCAMIRSERSAADNMRPSGMSVVCQHSVRTPKYDKLDRNCQSKRLGNQAFFVPIRRNLGWVA